MKIACVLITHFPVKTELQRRPELAGRPLIVLQDRGSRQFVLDCSPEASGVLQGMSAQEASSWCRDATLLEADEPRYRARFEEMLRSLEQRSPLVEAADLGCAYVGLEGLEPMYGGEARLVNTLLQAVPDSFNPRVGLATGKFPAYLAAVTSGPGRATRAPENVADFLGPFSLNLLPISWENKARLNRLGLSTLEQIARQPVGAMQSQFGPEGLRAWELAQGIDRRPLVPRRRETVIAESLTFPSPCWVGPSPETRCAASTSAARSSRPRSSSTRPGCGGSTSRKRRAARSGSTGSSRALWRRYPCPARWKTCGWCYPG